MSRYHARPAIDLPPETLQKWQSLVDVMAKVVGVPAGLIMRLNGPDIEVFVSSRTEGNPYHPGDREHFFDSGLYCETVVETNQSLLIPDALADEHWKNNPDVKLNMISYLGVPILMPDGSPFGTICVLDSKANGYSETYEGLLRELKELLESHLALMALNQSLGEKNRELESQLEVIKTLEGIIPICSYCKKVRDDEGYWQRVEAYLESRTEAQFSHGVCPECYSGQMEHMDATAR